MLFLFLPLPICKGKDQNLQDSGEGSAEVPDSKAVREAKLTWLERKLFCPVLFVFSPRKRNSESVKDCLLPRVVSVQHWPLSDRCWATAPAMQEIHKEENWTHFEGTKISVTQECGRVIMGVKVTQFLPQGLIFYTFLQNAGTIYIILLASPILIKHSNTHFFSNCTSGRGGTPLQDNESLGPTGSPADTPDNNARFSGFWYCLVIGP